MRRGSACRPIATGALGTTTLALILGEKQPITALALDGVTPSLKTLADGTYPHVKTIHVVVRDGARPAVAGFADPPRQNV